MAIKQKGDDGLPLKKKRKKRGVLSVPLSDEQYTKLIELRGLYEKGQPRPLSISDTVRACIEKQHEAELG